MTVRGLICVIVEAVLLVLGLGSGYRDLLIVAFCLGAFIGVALLSLLLALLTARFSGALSADEVLRREEVGYILTVSGVVLLPVTGYMLIASPGAEKQEKSARQRRAFLLWPTFRRRRLEVVLPCAYIGRWPVGPLRLRLEDLFGLFRFRLRGRLTRPLAVQPRLYDLEEERDEAVASGFSESQVRTASSGENLGDTRLYQPGDSLKRIHWKLSARTRELHTRQFEQQENAQVLLAVDMRCVGDDPRPVWNIEAETVLAVLTRLIAQRERVRLLAVRCSDAATLEERVITELPQVQALQENLLTVRLQRDAAPLEVWELREAGLYAVGTVVVITDHPSPSLLSELDGQAVGGRKVICVVPCVDTAPPDTVGSAVRLITLQTPEEIGEKVGDRL